MENNCLLRRMMIRKTTQHIVVARALAQRLLSTDPYSAMSHVAQPYCFSPFTWLHDFYFGVFTSSGPHVGILYSLGIRPFILVNSNYMSNKRCQGDHGDSQTVDPKIMSLVMRIIILWMVQNIITVWIFANN